jgi:hypothetical protein
VNGTKVRYQGYRVPGAFEAITFVALYFSSTCTTLRIHKLSISPPGLSLLSLPWISIILRLFRAGIFIARAAGTFFRYNHRSEISTTAVRLTLQIESRRDYTHFGRTIRSSKEGLNPHSTNFTLDMRNSKFVLYGDSDRSGQIVMRPASLMRAASSRSGGPRLRSWAVKMSQGTL